MPASLTVMAGPLAGTRLDFDESVDEILVGSDPDCRLSLDLPGVSPIHARVWLDAAGTTVFDTRSPRGVFVNDARVEGEAPLRDGDVLWLGAPDDAASVMIQYRAGAAVGEIDTGVADTAAPIDDSAPPPSDEFFFEDIGGPAPAAPADGDSAIDADMDLAGLVGDEPPAPDVEFGAPPAGDVAAEPVAAEPAAGEEVFFVDEAAEAPAPEPAPEEASAFVFDEPAAPMSMEATSSILEAPAEDGAPEFFVDGAELPPPPVPPEPPSAADPPAPPAPPASAAPRTPTPPAPAAAPAVPTAASPVLIQPPAAPERPRRAPGPPPAARPTPAPRHAPRPARSPVARYAAIGVGALLLLGIAGFFATRGLSKPSIATISPARVGLGQSVVITGKHFDATPQGNVVTFAGKPGRVMEASPERLQVEIPDMPIAPGRDQPTPIVVSVGGRATEPSMVAVYQAPRIHGISPTVAMPGDTVVLAGAGWGAGAKVRFGDREAAVTEASPASIKVTVPAIEGPPGLELPVTVSMGADTSNSAPFVLGRLPLVMGARPESADPGDVIVVSGRGFDVNPRANEVKIGGVRALVVSATNAELKVAVPRLPAGDAPVEVRVPGSDHVGQASLTVAPADDPIELWFVPEPFEDEPGHDHAVLATGIGPAFVLSAAQGKTAAQRAAEVAQRLNDAAGVLKATVDADLRVLDPEANPVLTLVGKQTPLIEVTAEDASAYDEDWTGLRGKGGPVTRARLALWWDAVARDLVLLLVRGAKPHFAADAAPEGRVLVDLHALARKTVAVGVPRQVIAEARPPLREGLRMVGLRVPAAVKPEAADVPVAPGLPQLRLDGSWEGTETDGGEVRRLSVTFSGATGTLTYQRAIAVSMPLSGVRQQRATVRFLVQAATGPRFYQGVWDGAKIKGTISRDETARTPIGTFELQP